jgi:WD40 repeat protein
MTQLSTESAGIAPKSGYLNLAVLCAALAVTVLIFALWQQKKSGREERAQQARADFLHALNLAEEGSKPEALHVLAESLRLQPMRNPASALAFELLTELRTNSSLLLRGHTDDILYAAFNADGTEVVTASKDHTARIWDARTGKLAAPPLQHNDDVLMAEFSPDGTRVVTASEDSTARVWDAKTGQPIGSPMQGTGEIRFARFSPDGKLVATGSDDSVARVWNAQTGEPVIPPVKYHESVFSVNFNPDSTRVVTATGDARADILDPQTGRHLADSIKHLNNVFTAVFSPDGTQILTGSADGTARIWDAKTGHALGPVFQHGFWIDSAVFNSDASRVATASWDHTARVWDAHTGQPITPPLQHGDAVFAAVFSPDGARVATASRDHTARVWDANSGDPLSLPLPAQDDAAMAVFKPGGFSLLVISRDYTVRLWDMPPRETAPVWLADLADFASTQVRYDQSRTPEMEKIAQLRRQLLASTSNDPWEKFGRWYFSESDMRPISPWSTLSLKEYVDGLITLGDKDSIDYAISLSQDHPTWMVQLVPLRAKFDAPAPSVPFGNGNPIPAPKRVKKP